MQKILIACLFVSSFILAGCGSEKTDTTVLTPLPSGANEALNEVIPDTQERVGVVVEDGQNDTEGQDDVVTSSWESIDDSIVGNPGVYVQGSESDIDSLINQGKKVILFFYADRCPTCQALDKDIQLNANKIPSEVAIIKLDYDKEESLKLTYDVKSQNTIIYLDKYKKSVATKAWGIIALDEVTKNMP